MGVRIRLKKLGRRHRPYYRICVMDARTPRDGKAIEEVGTYDPMIRETDKRCSMKAERIDYWLSVGALPTEKVKILIDKFKGKVPDVRIDQPRERTVPEIARLSAEQRVARKPKGQPAAAVEAEAAEPVAEDAAVAETENVATAEETSEAETESAAE